jgi:hypothetical protein
MDIESLASNGEAFIGCGRRESGVKWQAIDTKIVPNIACLAVFNTSHPMA